MPISIRRITEAYLKATEFKVDRVVRHEQAKKNTFVRCSHCHKNYLEMVDAYEHYQLCVDGDDPYCCTVEIKDSL